MSEELAELGLAVMPTYYNAGGGYPNLSGPGRRTKLDGNQNHHHTIPLNITSHALVQNVVKNLTTSQTTTNNIQQQQPNNTQPVSPTTTTTMATTTTHTSEINSSNVNNAQMPPSLIANNPRHEVKLNAMPLVYYFLHENRIFYQENN